MLIFPSKIFMELLAAYIQTFVHQIGERYFGLSLENLEFLAFLPNYNLPCPTCWHVEPHAMSFKTSFWLRNPHDKEATTGKSYYGDASLYFLRADGEEAPKIDFMSLGSLTFHPELVGNQGMLLCWDMLLHVAGAFRRDIFS